MAASIAPLTTVVMNAVGQENAGIASGVNNAASRAAGLLSIALLGILLANVFGKELERRVDALPIDPSDRQEVLRERNRLAAAEPPAGLSTDEAAHVRAAIEAAFVAGFQAVARASALLALAACLSSWLWIGKESKRSAAS
jgi:hypothetical protein